MTVFYIVIAILLFGFLILAHEFGHFITAKLSNVRVNEFALFMGPAIWKKQKGETLYALRCIPVGGYCAMEGEDGDSDDPRAFGRAKLWKKLMILVAGSGMNFLVGFLMVLLLVTFSYDVVPTHRVAEIEKGTVAEQVFLPGDEIVEINGERVYIYGDVLMLLDRQENGVQEITVVRNGKEITFSNVQIHDGSGTETYYGFRLARDEKTIGNVLGYSWNNCVDFVRMVRMGLQDLFTGRAGVKDMSGPVGIVGVVVEQGVSSETVGMGLANVLYLFAFIAINLAVMNLLPIPALDGGRVVTLLLTTLIEKIIGRKLNPKYEAVVNGVFLILLLALIVLISFKDIFQLFGG